MAETYDVKITSSAETRALEDYLRQLAATTQAAKAAGLGTRELEADVARVNAQLGQSRVRDHAAALREAITQTKAAGQATADLERQLRQLENLRPREVANLGKLSTDQARALGASSSDLERSIRRTAPALPAAAQPVGASAETRALEEYQSRLNAAISAARANHLATREMEKSLEDFNRQLGQSRLRDYTAQLRESIGQARAAGRDTAALERQLRQIEGLRPASGVARFFSAIREAARDIPGVGGFVSVWNGMSAAVAVGTGLAAAGIARLTAAAMNFVRTGVEFNAQLETSQLGLAAVFRQFDRTGRFTTFESAMVSAGQAIDLLKAKAASSPASFESLLSAFQGTAGQMAQAGMSIKQQVDTIGLLSQTLAGLGIRPEQMLQESRAILTGNITEDALAARTLGITPEMIRTAKEQGNLYEFLQLKMAGFAEAGARAGETLTVRWSNVQDRLQQLAATASQPAFESLKGFLGGIDQGLQFVQGAVGGSTKDEMADTRTKAEQAAQAVRDLNQKRLDDLARTARDAKKEFEDLAKTIAETYRMLMALAEARAGVVAATTDREEQAALAGAVGNPRRQAEIRAQFAERRVREQYAAEDAQLRLQIQAQQSLRDNANTRIRPAEQAAERARLLALGADAEAGAAANNPTLARAVRPEAVTNPAVLNEDIGALEARRLELQARLGNPANSVGRGIATGLSGRGILGAALEVADDASSRETNAAALRDVEERLAAAKALADAQSRALAMSNAAKAADKDLASIRKDLTVSTKEIEVLEQKRAAARTRASAGIAGVRNERAEAGATQSREERDRKVELEGLRAQARGDVRGQRRAEWTRNYWAEWDKTGDDAQAREMANARMAASSSWTPQVSSQAASGNAVGENLAIARAALAEGASSRPAEQDPAKQVVDLIRGVITRGAIKTTTDDRPPVPTFQ